MTDTRPAAAADRAELARRIRAVSWLSLAWMGAEGVIGVAAGLATGSIALLGYGLDSAVQALGSGVIVWRFTTARIESPAAEARAQRLVATSFFLLAPYIAVEATRRLLVCAEAEGTWIGIALATVGLVLMPVFGHLKRRLGAVAASPATTGEGTQHLICAALSCALLLGLLANAVLGWWWADPLAALLLAAAAVHAGTRTWRGRGTTTC